MADFNVRQEVRCRRIGHCWMYEVPRYGIRGEFYGPRKELMEKLGKMLDRHDGKSHRWSSNIV